MMSKYSEHTKTALFLVPLLGRSVQSYGSAFVNAFLGDRDVVGFDEYTIYVLLKFSGSVKSSYTRMNNWLCDHPDFFASYDIHDGEYVMYVMNVPEKFERDYELLVCKDEQGFSRYSLLSNEAKQLLMIDRTPDSAMPAILTKTPVVIQSGRSVKEINPKKYWEDKIGIPLGDLEIWPKMEIEYEIFEKQHLDQRKRKSPAVANNGKAG